MEEILGGGNDPGIRVDPHNPRSSVANSNRISPYLLLTPTSALLTYSSAITAVSAVNEILLKRPPVKTAQFQKLFHG